MSWHIVLFNSKQKIDSISELEETQLEPTDFSSILDNSSEIVNKDKNHREIVGPDFTIYYFAHKKPVSKTLLNVYGEKGLYHLVELAKAHNWQIYDSANEKMIDLDAPNKNGFKKHCRYMSQTLHDNRILNFDIEFITICRQILEKSRNVNDWILEESCDEFQTQQYCGGFDGTEKEFTFSYFDHEGNEYWFQLPLSDIENVEQGIIKEIEIRKVK